jgi:NAD(P)-dependent dehydrogenase (short-subunit alcohol dehydrogenase family)
LDIVIKNAALYPHLSTADQDVDELTHLFNVNVRAPFVLAKTLVSHMIRQGSGVIVNLGSIAGLTGLPTTAADGLTRAALTSLTRTWAAEYGSQGPGLAPRELRLWRQHRRRRRHHRLSVGDRAPKVPLQQSVSITRMS